MKNMGLKLKIFSGYFVLVILSVFLIFLFCKEQVKNRMSDNRTTNAPRLPLSPVGKERAPTDNDWGHLQQTSLNRRSSERLSPPITASRFYSFAGG